jgi:hypothetical protein
VANFCVLNQLPLSVASIPPDAAAGNMLTFDTAVMRHIFDAAALRAEESEFW